ncbi:MAG: sigma-70 family RNA polymerase sigma factor [Oscillospiraceae bacterium]|nr:sigma-70 family RNA polymerase sigma factor [Oscillospiraceae bacterium]
MTKRRHQYQKIRRVSEASLAFDPVWIAKLCEEQDGDIEPTPEMKRLKNAIGYAWNNELSACQRKYFLLYYRDGLNMREVGTRCNVSESTVSRTLTRARRTLRHYLMYYYRMPSC